MILCDWQIKKYCLEEKMIAPFDEELLNPASLDLRVGEHLQLLTNSGFVEVYLNKYSQADPYYLFPGDRALVSSLEVFNMPKNVCGMFKLKSSRGREFYQHMFAGFIDPGFFDSHLTLEIVNQSVDRLPLYPHFKIGQIIFFQTETPELSYKEKGRYNNDKGAVKSKG